MSHYDNGIVVGFIGGKDYVSQDNGDGTHSLICPIGDVPEIKRNHDRLEKENADLKEELQAKTDLLGLVIAEKAGLEKENAELREALPILKQMIFSMKTNAHTFSNENVEEISREGMAAMALIDNLLANYRRGE